jgi:hypothetical protein
MELSDKSNLTGFIIESVTPADIQLGEPVITGDTIKIPVLRGITLFPMKIVAKPIYSASTERAVPGVSFASFDDITFDLEDVQPNIFYLVAQSGHPTPYYIQLDIEPQDDRNNIKQFNVTGYPSNSRLATKGFVNPITRTVTLYGFNTVFPLELTAETTLSDSACLKETVDIKALKLSFSKYGDRIEYNVEAQNGDVRRWAVVLERATEIRGTESSDILSAVSLDAKKQRAGILTDGFEIADIGVDNQTGQIILSVSPNIGNNRIEIIPTLVTLPNSQIIGYRDDESLSFENHNTVKEFIILDARTGYFRKWQFVLTQGDVGDIHRFPYTYSSTGNCITMNYDATVIDNIHHQIQLQVTHAGSSCWPLSLTAGAVEHSEGASININQPLVFDNINDSAHFIVISSSETSTTWSISLTSPQTVGQANIENVSINASSYPELADDDVLVNETTAEVFIDLDNKNMLPLHIQPHLHLSDGAEFTTFQNGDFMEFRTFTDIVTVEIISRSGETKTWRFQLLDKRQLPNSNFELWRTYGTPTIDPVPGRGRGWATANNIMVQGTKRVDNGANGFAAELTTNIISIPKNLITSATLFLGDFDMTSITLDKPRSMTKFGVPFEARPVAFAIDVKYTPGEQYQQSRLVGGSGVLGQYALDDIDGDDRGQIYAELIHWSGNGPLNYASEPVTGVHLLARGEYIISGKTDWTRLSIPLSRLPEYEQYRPTHLVFVAASSIDGHLFKGAKGSQLTVDNFELIY